jgi:thiol-disulfide isomerase/thioredoxin
MRILKSAVLYAGLALGAIGVAPVAADTGTLIALASGDMAKLRFASEPKHVPLTKFADANGKQVSLKNYRGKYVLLNFWALWCAPCREEMPDLEALNSRMQGTGFEVVTVATGRNARPAVDKFFDQHDLATLPKLFDPKMNMARDFRALGLPVTILIDPEGREIARADGAAAWDGPDAIALFQAWMAGS